MMTVFPSVIIKAAYAVRTRKGKRTVGLTSGYAAIRLPSTSRKSDAKLLI